MAEFGDVIKVPGVSSIAEVTPGDILASYARFTQKGVTLLAGNGVVEAGTALGRVTASKKYVPHDNSASDGSEVAKGFLRQPADTTDNDVLGNIVVSGILKYSVLTFDHEASTITDLNARVDTVQDLFIF